MGHMTLRRRLIQTPALPDLALVYLLNHIRNSSLPHSRKSTVFGLLNNQMTRSFRKKVDESICDWKKNGRNSSILEY